jgi:hypothetical protein
MKFVDRPIVFTNTIVFYIRNARKNKQKISSSEKAKQKPGFSNTLHSIYNENRQKTRRKVFGRVLHPTIFNIALL